MATLRELIVFSRIHTASLTIPVVLIAAVVSGWNYLYIALFAAFALLFHMTGFAMNNLADYEYDKLDPYKKHFPLVSGRINYSNAMMVDIILFAVTYGFAILLVGGRIIPVIFASVAFFTGVGYNFLNKRSKYGPTLISLSFSMLIPYVMLGDGYSHYIVILLYTAFAYLTMMYQISVSGYIKDIETPQYNMLSKMGMRLLAGQIIFGMSVVIYSAALRYAIVVTGLILVGFITHTSTVVVIAYMTVYAIFQISTIILSGRMIRNQKWVRDRFLKRMSLIEIMNYFSIAILFGIIYGAYWVIFLIIFPIVWFIVFNRFMFHSTMFPRV